MCLDVIGYLIAEVDNRLVDDLDRLSTKIGKSLSPESLEILVELEERHRARTREIGWLAFRSGVAAGRGLATFFDREE